MQIVPQEISGVYFQLISCLQSKNVVSRTIQGEYMII